MTQASAAGNSDAVSSAPGTGGDTPAMRQHREFKQKHPDCVLFFRMGDFYELFYDDAVLAHKVLGVTLTQRTAGIPMAGVPYHAVDNYLRRMIQAGYRVAVCEQMQDPATTKGLIKREVTRLITPGTLTDESLLEEGSENPLAAVALLDEKLAAVAWAELSTGAFSVATFQITELVDELARIHPREILFAQNDRLQDPPKIISHVAAALSITPAPRPGWQFRQRDAVEMLCKQFGITTVAGLGFEESDPMLGPAAAVLHYLHETQSPSGENAKSNRLAHLRPPKKFDRSEFLVIDQVSLRSLEIERTLRSGASQGSLLGLLQDCQTAMGKRFLRQVLCYPLRDRVAISQRQQAIAEMVQDSAWLEELRKTLGNVQDVERIVARVAVGRASPRDLVALARSAGAAKEISNQLLDRPSVAPFYQQLQTIVAWLTEFSETVGRACIDSPPGHLREGGLFRDGFDAQLDEYRNLQNDSNTWIVQYQKQLIENTGISSLKVGFNKVFGFYIELTSVHQHKAPIEWARKQTLKNAERYTTPELKEYEGKVLSAQQRAIAREQELFAELCTQAQQGWQHLSTLGLCVGQLDVLACLAKRAARHRWVRPTLVDEPGLWIKSGRHPVLEDFLGDRFVPNDIALGVPQNDRAPASLALITGPNMAGKSTYIRQAALITLLAHTGSFVPADEAVVGLCDRIFTRIGAADELHTGQSTFMVEMTETANICHHATEASLVILDEIGRGTSTLDGLSLAWAIAEFLAKKKCRTLFATHYHELTELSETHENVCNLNVTVREWQDEIVFLHRIAPGKADKSYGIHVAKIAGLPKAVVKRANELLGQLEVNHHAQTSITQGKTKTNANAQLSLFTEYLDHPAVGELRKIELDSLSPMQAFDALRKLREMIDQG